MFNRIHALSTAAALSLSLLSMPVAAQQAPRADAVDAYPVIGAMYDGLIGADNEAKVRRQGGFATAGAVRWLATAPQDEAEAKIPVPTVVGAMYESRSLARDAADVRRQGGYATAGAARWLPAAPQAEANAQAVYGAPVLGALYVDARRADSEADVRRQGGFATAGAVRWLDAPVAAQEAKASVSAAAF